MRPVPFLLALSSIATFCLAHASSSPLAVPLSLAVSQSASGSQVPAGPTPTQQICNSGVTSASACTTDAGLTAACSSPGQDCGSCSGSATSPTSKRCVATYYGQCVPGGAADGQMDCGRKFVGNCITVGSGSGCHGTVQGTCPSTRKSKCQ